MKSLLLTALAFAGLCTRTIAQDEETPLDTIELQRGPAVTSCIIKEISCEKVSYVLMIGGSRTTQSANADDVRSIILGHPDNRPFEFDSAERSLEANDYPNAIRRLENLIKNATAKDPTRQCAHRMLIECHRRSGDVTRARDAIASLRKEHPKSFFLKETYEIEFEISLGGQGDPAGVLRAMEQKATELSLDSWKPFVGLKQAGLLEFSKQWKDAQKKYDELARSSAVKTEATIGALRCLSEANEAGELDSRSAAILRQSSEALTPRLLMAAYVARGDARRIKGKLKDALLDYLRVAIHIGPKQEKSTPEHESALGRAAITAAKFAADPANSTQRETYRTQATRLLQSLTQEYGNESRWAAEAQKAISEIP